MDIGDIIRLIFFGIIFLSFFGGFFGRKSGEEKQAAPRPTDVFESGGQPIRPQPVRTQTAEPMAQEVSWEDAPQGRQVDPRFGEGRQSAYGDSTGPRNGSGSEPQPRSQPTQAGNVVERTDVRAAERELLEQDLTDLPPAMDLNPERQVRRQRRVAASARRKHPATGGDVLRHQLKDPDTLERSFIIKEVLDIPVGMRRER